jgi:hypothetical protein
MGRVLEHGTEPARNLSGAFEVHRALCNTFPRQDFAQHDGKSSTVAVQPLSASIEVMSF